MTGNNSSENINVWLSQINNDYKAAFSVDCVIFGYDEESLRVLLMKSDMPPFENMYSLVGDLVRPDETLNQSANRILEYRTGLSDVFMDQVGVFSEIGRHPLGRVISIAYYSLIKLDAKMLDLSTQNEKLIWKKVDEIEELAFDHKNILECCHKTLQEHLRDRPIGFNLLPSKFSLRQLQSLYERVLDINLDKRNFRRKLRSLDILLELEEIQQEVNHRPAQLYTFDSAKYDKKIKKGFNFDL